MHVYHVIPATVTAIDMEPVVEAFSAPVMMLTQACDWENDLQPGSPEPKTQ